jgi:hypothetical protein
MTDHQWRMAAAIIEVAILVIGTLLITLLVVMAV